MPLLLDRVPEVARVSSAGRSEATSAVPLRPTSASIRPASPPTPPAMPATVVGSRAAPVRHDPPAHRRPDVGQAAKQERTIDHQGPERREVRDRLRPFEGQGVREPVSIAGIERLVDAADADRHRLAVDPAALDGDALTDLEPELARGGAGDRGHDRAVGVRVGRRPVAGDESSVVGQAVRLAEDEDVARRATGQAVAVRGDGAPGRAEGRAQRSGQLRVDDAFDLFGFLGVDRGRQLQVGIGPGCRREDLLDGRPRDRVRAHRAGDHGRRGDDDGQPGGRHQDAVVADARHDEPEPAAPGLPSTRPDLRLRPLRRAVVWLALPVGRGLGDVAGRRARCVVALRAWRGGGRHLLSVAPSWHASAVGSPTLPDDGSARGIRTARRRAP